MNLTDIQEQIVKTTEGPVLVTAGAGSGKTRVLTERAAFMVRELGVSINSILLLTFTNKAANEMLDRVRKSLNNYDRVMWGTFHSFCARVLRKNIDHLPPYNTNFSIYSEADKERVLKEILAANGYQDKQKKEMLDEVDYYLSLFKNNGATEFSCSDEIKEIIIKYQKQLETNNALDFDDLLLKALELFQKVPEVLQRYQEQFKYIMVDEFQDTNLVQYEIVKRIADRHKNIMVVGDEDQCIYTWRGASIENILNFKNDFKNVKIFKLEENFRSSKNIIERANRLIKNNTSRLDKTLFANNKDGVFEFKQCFNEKYEAISVVETIYNLVNQLGYSYSDFAVLMRVNALSRSFEEQFLNYNMPHVVYGGFKFYERVEVKNVLSYLRALVNPQDEQSFFRIINFPKRGIGEAACEQIKREAILTNKTILEAIETSANNKVKQFYELFYDLKKALNEMNFYSFFEFFLKRIEIESYYKSTKKDEDLSRLENIYSLLGAVKDYCDMNKNANINNYLETVTLVTDLDTNDNSNAITLATIHSAKGLEFRTVFIVGCDEGIFPNSRRTFSISELEEERRLMYVAVTRAKERVYLTSCSERFLHGESKVLTPSRFLKELGIDTENSYQKSSYSERAEKYNDSYSSYKTENVKTLKSNYVDKFKVNTAVYHEKFGKGIVVEIIVGGLIKVDFESVGNKTLSLEYAKLDILS